MNNQTIEIYFNDLKPEKQKKLLQAAGVTDPKEMNWEYDLIPLAIIDFEGAE